MNFFVLISNLQQIFKFCNVFGLVLAIFIPKMSHLCSSLNEAFIQKFTGIRKVENFNLSTFLVHVYFCINASLMSYRDVKFLE